MLTYPNAKINLGLHIVEKRPDSYHNIETVFYPINGLSDILEIIPSKNGNTTLVTTGLAIDGTPDSNLCVNAWKLLKKDFDIPAADIYLHKQIPLGAGLGGGSADAAFTLKLLNELHNLHLSTTALKDYALQLGSDCAFFIINKPVLAKGRGEQLTPIPLSLKGKHIVIVHPKIHASTATAYASIIPKKPDFSLEELPALQLSEWKLFLKNDFEESIFNLHPEVAEIKTKLYENGASYASMSGSGSAVFGIFEELSDISEAFPNYYTFTGLLDI